jgi:hypothetical protein
MIKKEHLNIIQKNSKYRIAMRQSFLIFFNRWVELTWREEDNVDRPIEFLSYDEAIEFVDTVSQ